MISADARVALGLDFGTESVRAVAVSLAGEEIATAVEPYPHGQIIEGLPARGREIALPADFALQHPADWLAAAGRVVRAVLLAGGIAPANVIGVGIDFTSCTMLPCREDGTPLALLPEFAERPHAWPKLWKHHGAKRQTDDLNRIALQRGERWLDRYGGTIGLEWLFPKMLECFDEDRAAFDAAALFLEAGDWFVWQLVGGPVAELPRSTCQAGYKACWSPEDGYPSREYLDDVRPEFGEGALARLPGRHVAPGTCAGSLGARGAELIGLQPGTPVSAAVIDAHAGVPGAGVGESGTLVMVLGTSSCHMLCADDEVLVPGVAGIVRDGILPGSVGYEMGQAAVGDAFAWVGRTTGRALDELAREAASVPAGADGVVCIDWFNGCRTPLMDGELTASFHGITLRTTAAHLYRAVLEGTAFGCRWILELLRAHDVEVRRVVATGGLPHEVPLLVQIYADVLGMPIAVHPARHGSAVGAAILGALAAGREATGFTTVAEAIAAMAARPSAPIAPDAARHAVYEPIYARYRRLATG